MKTTFTPHAKCKTFAPSNWHILLSQRRRWINSTVHNLFELLFVKRLCGFFCCSMRFVVFLDLLSTMLQPAAILYVGWLIYSTMSEQNPFPVISLALLCAIYGLQLIVFILKRAWKQVVWMLVYIFAIPLWTFWLPCYAFWHFDDFSWGNTRLVRNDKGVTTVATVRKFNPASVPKLTYEEYRRIRDTETMQKEEVDKRRLNNRIILSYKKAYRDGVKTEPLPQYQWRSSLSEISKKSITPPIAPVNLNVKHPESGSLRNTFTNGSDGRETSGSPIRTTSPLPIAPAGFDLQLPQNASTNSAPFDASKAKAVSKHTQETSQTPPLLSMSDDVLGRSPNPSFSDTQPFFSSNSDSGSRQRNRNDIHVRDLASEQRNMAEARSSSGNSSPISCSSYHSGSISRTTNMNPRIPHIHCRSSAPLFQLPHPMERRSSQLTLSSQSIKSARKSLPEIVYPNDGNSSQITSVTGQSFTSAHQSSQDSRQSKTSAQSFPSREALVNEIRTILTTSDLMAISKKTVREQLSNSFGLDMGGHREEISLIVDEILDELI